MRAILKLEQIGDDFFYAKRHNTWSFDKQLRYMRRFGGDKSSSWAARVVGVDPDGRFKREYLQGQRDYTEANSEGSRGIFTYHPLIDGIYEVNSRYHWRKVKHYFIKVIETEIIEISKEGVMRCLRS